MADCTVRGEFTYTRYPCDYDIELDTDSKGMVVVEDNITPVVGEVPNRARESVLAVQYELGLNPSGTYTTVRARLDALDAQIASIIVGGGGSVTVQDEGVTTVAAATILDFVGSAVTVTDGGSNKAIITVTGTGGGGDGYIAVEDESVSVSSQVRTLNFIGADVQAIDAGSYKVNVFIPPPSYESHWNTTDGTTTGTVSESGFSRTTTRISTPTVEGTPFYTGGWAGTNQSTTATHGTATFTSSQDTIGFGGDSTMTVTVYNGDGSVNQTYTTPALTGIAAHSSGNITVTITGYAASGLKYKAKASVAVNTLAAFPNGGRYHVVVSHTTDTTTDGGGTYTYTQSDVFIDTNPTTPTIIDGYVAIAETAGSVLTKHLSGIEYYILGSQFTADVVDIDDMNENTQRISSQFALQVEALDYGLSTLQHHPAGTGSGNFSGWTNAYDQDNVDYQVTNWTITDTNYRFRGDTANASAYPRDPWGSGSTVYSSNASILIDTYTDSSSNANENFNSEVRRHEDGYFLSQNGLYGDDGYVTGNWDETSTLVAGEALVMGGQLMVPNQSTLAGDASTANADWTTYEPSLGGANPDYSSLTVPVSYYRTFIDTNYTDPVYATITGFTMTFTGTFASGYAAQDLTNGDLEVKVWKIITTVAANDGTLHQGPPEHLTTPNNHPLSLDGSLYNFGTFNDYNSYNVGTMSPETPDGQIRTTASNTTNAIQATFGGYQALLGIHVQITINDPAIKISNVSVSFDGTPNP